MAKIKKDIQTAFLTLVRSGLWEQDVQIKQFEKIDYSEVFRLAEEQSEMVLLQNTRRIAERLEEAGRQVVLL